MKQLLKRMPMNKAFRSIIALVSFLAAAGLIGLGISCHPPNTNPNVSDLVPLPVEKEVVSIHATVHKEFGVKTTLEFMVPPKYFSVILGALTPAKKCDACQSFMDPPLGEFRIATNNARLIHVRFGWAGQNPLCFSVDGFPCARDGPYCPYGEFGIDEGARLHGFLTALYREETEQTKSEMVPWYIEQLEWSRGLKKAQSK